MNPVLAWYGHSCFRLDFGTGGSVVFDPYEVGSVPGVELPDELSADLVLCSHSHGDHNAAERVKLSGNMPRYAVSSIGTFHDPEKGKKRGANNIYIAEYEGFRAVHLGDLGCALTADETRFLRGADLLLIPVGGFFTIGPREAKEIIDALQPRVAVPMHYRRGKMGYPVISPLSDFTGLFDSVTEIPSNTLELKPELAGVYVLNV